MYATPATVYDSYEHLNLVHRLRSPNPLAYINRGENIEVHVLLKNDHERINRVTRGFCSSTTCQCPYFIRWQRQPKDATQWDNPTHRFLSCSLLSPLISMRSNAVHSITQVSSSHSNMSEPFSSILIPDGNQVKRASSGNTIPQAWPDGLLDDQAWITYKCS